MKNEFVEITSLRIGSENVQKCLELSVPPLQKINLELRKSVNQNTARRNVAEKPKLWQEGASIPGAVGPMFCTRVKMNECISNRKSERIRKPKFMLELELLKGQSNLAKEVVQNFDAGDSYCVFFENPSDEVGYLLDRLKDCYSAVADTEFEFIWAQGTPPPNQQHLPKYCTARRLLSQFIDIRRAPGRSLIRALAEFAGNSGERRRLLELASTQGAKEFTQFVRQANISLIELFATFPSIKPPLALLIELQPRLLPRHYTLAKFLQLSEGESLKFLFAYSLLPQNGSIETQNDRFGVCSQWLFSRKIGDAVWLAQKEASKFRFPPISTRISNSFQNQQHLLTIPILMIGPGTGVAPFISFLQKIRYIKKQISIISNAVDAKRILIYASSSLEDEFLFREELEEMKAQSILSQLVVCESRSIIENWKESNCRPPKIYDALKGMADEVAEFLFPSSSENSMPLGLVYACGDVKNMSRELWACFDYILQRKRNMSPMEAIEHLKRMRQETRLIEDVWS